MMVIVLVGAPGSGKGTQASLLVRNCGFIKIVMGDIVRKYSKMQTKLGNQISDVVNSGGLLEDSIVYEMLQEELKVESCNSEKSIIFDGFPRTLVQAQMLDELVSNLKGNKVNLVIDFVIREKKLFDRILKRFSCINCGFSYNYDVMLPKGKTLCDFCGGTEFSSRDDDKVDVLMNRLFFYHNFTENVLPYYARNGVLKSVSGDMEVNKLHNVIKSFFVC